MASKKGDLDLRREGKPKAEGAYQEKPGGKFAKGNPGKPKGAQADAKRKIALVFRRVLLEAQAGDQTKAEVVFRELLDDSNPGIRIDALKLGLERGWGKAPQTVLLGMDPNSPEAYLLELDGQPIPGGGGVNEDEDEER